MKSTWDLTEPERPLVLPECTFELRAVLPAFPRHAGIRMDAIDHYVDLPMRAVLVGHHHRLMLGQSQVSEHAVRDSRMYREAVHPHAFAR